MMKAKQKFRKVKLVKLASDEMDGWTMSIVHWYGQLGPYLVFASSRLGEWQNNGIHIIAQVVKAVIVNNGWQFHNNALWNKSNGSYDIKEFGTLPLIFSTSKYFRWKFQPWPSFFPHANIPDTWKRGQLSLEQMKKMEKVKVKSHLRYLAACSVQKKRWDIWRIFFSDFRSVFSP